MISGMSHSDERRRRLLSEDASPAEPTRTRTSAAAGPPPGYADAARRQHQPHLTDFVPLRGWVHALLFAGGALTIAGVAAAYWFVPGATDGRWPLLDVSLDGSLAAWLGSLTLACAAPLALLIYAVRRHRLDDYRGRYRMWLFAAPALLALSLEQTAALEETLRGALEAATGWSVFAAGAVYWPLLVGSVLTLLAVRLAFEMRRCLGATFGAVLALILGSAALAAAEGWLTLEAGRVSAVVLATLQLAAALVLLTSLGVYARHVILAAEGRLAVRVKKVRTRAAAPTVDEASLDTGDGTGKKRLSAVAKIDPPQVLKGPITARTDLASTAAATRPAATAARSQTAAVPARSAAISSSAAKAVADDDEDAGPRKLSKAERKALKRQRMADDEQDDWWERGD